MKIPAPIEVADVLYTDVELKKPSAYVLADTKKIIDSTGNQFSGMKKFIHGCVSSVSNDTVSVIDPIGIQAIIGKMPFKAAEYVALKSALMFAEDDGIEGCYACPRCGHKIIKEKKTLDGDDYDTRDFVSTMELGFASETSKTFTLSEPVQVLNKTTKDVVSEFLSITMNLPTLDNTVSAMEEYGRNDSIRLQFAQYAKAITHVNGEPVDNKWRAQWGVYLFEHIVNVKEDLGQISDWIMSIGLQTNLQRTCPQCGKEWKAYVDVTNFFVSGLQ